MKGEFIMKGKVFSVFAIILGLVIAAISIAAIVGANGAAVGASVYVFAGAGILFVILGIVLFIMNSKKAKEEAEDDEEDEYDD